LPLGSSCLSAQSSVPALQRDSERVYCFDGLTVLVIKTDVTYTVTHQTTQILPPAGPPKRSRREPQEAVRTASRSVEHVARSMPASALRTLWTVAKPKTPMVAVRWRERRRSRPHPSRRRPNLTRKNPTRPNNPTQPKKHDSQVGPSGCRRATSHAGSSQAMRSRSRSERRRGCRPLPFALGPRGGRQASWRFWRASRRRRASGRRAATQIFAHRTAVRAVGRW